LGAGAGAGGVIPVSSLIEFPPFQVPNRSVAAEPLSFAA
jgi:hypothetical protein